jgi:hypothetical protein
MTQMHAHKHAHKHAQLHTYTRVRPGTTSSKAPASAREQLEQLAAELKDRQNQTRDLTKDIK